MTERLNQAIQLIKAGQKEQARAILADILKSEPSNEMAWLWLTQCLHSDAQRIVALKQCLKFNPESQAAQKGLEQLSQQQENVSEKRANDAQSPDAQLPLEQPPPTPLPAPHTPTVDDPQQSISPEKHLPHISWWEIGLIGLTITVALAAIGIFLWERYKHIPQTSTQNNTLDAASGEITQTVFPQKTAINTKTHFPTNTLPATKHPTPISTPKTSSIVPTPEMPNGPMILYLAPDTCVVKAVSIHEEESFTLTSDPPIENCQRPTFSPDGKKLAFVLAGEENALYVMNLDGSDLTKVASTNSFAWSPNSRQLAYHSYDSGTQRSSLAVINVDGNNPGTISYQDISICSDCDVGLGISWSLDGTWLYVPANFRSPGSGPLVANIFKTDGTKHYQLDKQEVSSHTAAAWAPNSRWLAVPITPNGNGCGEILLASSQGITETLSANRTKKPGESKIGPSCFNLSEVFWSPNGKQILAFGHPQGNFAPGEVKYDRILIASSSNKDVKLLEYWSGHPGTALWSPDGSQIVFISSPDMKSDRGDGPLVIMHNDPDLAEYKVLAEKARNSPGALFWLDIE